jgi:hypothetical protein
MVERLVRGSAFHPTWMAAESLVPNDVRVPLYPSPHPLYQDMSTWLVVPLMCARLTRSCRLRKPLFCSHVDPSNELTHGRLVDHRMWSFGFSSRTIAVSNLQTKAGSPMQCRKNIILSDLRNEEYCALFLALAGGRRRKVFRDGHWVAFCSCKNLTFALSQHCAPYLPLPHDFEGHVEPWRLARTCPRPSLSTIAKFRHPIKLNTTHRAKTLPSS